MPNIQYHLLKPTDSNSIELISDWYLSEWNIPKVTTIQKIKGFSEGGSQFQILMTLDNIPIATGGIYDHVSLLDREPRFRVYKNWLALVYTKPENRGKGMGALICENIQQHAKAIGMKEIFLFTHTAESLYKRLGWLELERLSVGGKNIVVMKK